MMMATRMRHVAMVAARATAAVSPVARARVSVAALRQASAALSTSTRSMFAQPPGGGASGGDDARAARTRAPKQNRQQQQKHKQHQPRTTGAPGQRMNVAAATKGMPTPEDQMVDLVRNVLQSQQPAEASSPKRLREEFNEMKAELKKIQQQIAAAAPMEPEEAAAEEPAPSEKRTSGLQETEVTAADVFANAKGDINPDTEIIMDRTGHVHVENSGHVDYDIEDLKPITFQDLSRINIRHHAQHLRDRMRAWREPLPEEFLQIETRNYYHVGSQGSHIPEARKVILTAKVSQLGLNAAEREKLLQLVGSRYRAATDTLKLVGRRYPTREMNLQYVKDLITVLVAEAKNPELQLAELQESA
ncbi:hypothetical protein PTSG_07217 [Salpingoeca rosetta]|uniref:Small ribosomal subunit protein mS35 mitochondrial conserved domain-containing protein n=1 Tax=Salpingoeca rosetta (strain ATCC 50818 / BSB-021) TaxID=946362 RepID=F2UEE4_SALR5|nr:uncharacterized protein PTSG_07217 [Salpingoeca rosetta]EGD74994.1 hypothetical protein PTSG_07217 [Salpingoeca rosetta]|eukprot:XP_004992639.1 hypothetical protein PTSG_07217 [Salpingoeca rosetta]